MAYQRQIYVVGHHKLWYIMVRGVCVHFKTYLKNAIFLGFYGWQFVGYVDSKGAIGQFDR